MKDTDELFVFFKYYDGYASAGEVGFSPTCGPPGSVNHMRAYFDQLAGWSEQQFRSKGKILGVLAKTFVEENVLPPDDLRPPEPQSNLPWALIDGALEGGY